MSYYNVQDRIYNELAFELRYFILFDLQLAFLQFLLSFQKSSQYQFSSLILTKNLLCSFVRFLDEQNPICSTIFV